MPESKPWNPVGKMVNRISKALETDPERKKATAAARKKARKQVREAFGLSDADSPAERRKKADKEKPATLQSDGVYR